MEKIELENAKYIGATGVILSLAGLLSVWKFGYSIVFSIVSSVFILISLNTISKKVENHKIFSNYLTGFILQVIYSIVFIISEIKGVATLIIVFGRGFIGIDRFGNIGANDIIAFMVFYIFFVISYYFVKKSLDLIRDTLSNKHFKIAGLFLFVGAILGILFGVGFFVMFIGEIFAIIGFFAIPDEVSKKPLEESGV
jgi:uncharacterized membrane protein